MESEALLVQSSLGGGVELITVPSIEFSQSGRMDRCLLEGIEDDRHSLIVDITGLPLACYELLEKLLSARRRLEPQGVRMAVICGAHDRRILELGGLGSRFLLASSLAEAYAGLGVETVRPA